MTTRRTTLLALFFLLMCASESFAQTDRELRLYEIYQNYHSKPTDPSVWNQLTQSLQTETYRIQPGDNLWVISKIFFGDGNYWPKVWSVNSRIENPHLIEPGNEIRFRLGTSESEPSFFITEPGSIMSDGGAVSLAANGNSGVGIETPPPTVRPMPVLKDIPPSLPEWSYGEEAPSEENQWGLEIVPRPSLKLMDHTYLQSFVVDSPVPFAGEVVEPQVDDELMVQGNNIFVRIEGEAQTGQTYLVVSDTGPLAYRSEDSDAKGRVLRVAAEVTLVEPLNVKRPRRGYSYFEARINRSLGLATRGHKLLPGKIKRIDLSKPGRVSDVEVEVVGGQLDNQGFQFGAGNVVYLDKGANSGLSEGDIFIIQKVKERRFREPDPLVEFTQIQAGQVQVVDVREGFSTAIVLGSSRAIRPGDESIR